MGYRPTPETLTFARCHKKGLLNLLAKRALPFYSVGQVPTLPENAGTAELFLFILTASH